MLYAHLQRHRQEQLVQRMLEHRHFLRARVSNHHTSESQVGDHLIAQQFRFSFSRPSLPQVIVWPALSQADLRKQQGLLLQMAAVLYQ